MVLAAGLGTRLQPFTLKTPKPLIPLLGVPCVEYSLMQLHDAGVGCAILNSHAHRGQLQQYLKSNPVQGLELKESSEASLLLGSAGGFRQALPMLGHQGFVGVNADVIQLVPLLELWATHQRLRAERKVAMTLALLSGDWLRAQGGVYREIVFNPSTGMVLGFSAQKKSNTPFYTGVGIFEPEAFEALPMGQPSEFVPDVLEPWIKKKRVGMMLVDALWMDIGSPELWWRSHFELYHRYRNQALPQSWLKRIQNGLQHCRIDPVQKTVDYDLSPVDVLPGITSRSVLGKNSIRLHNEIYAVSNLANP
jgi:NDP-sugar pyrophosphorylase family protein